MVMLIWPISFASKINQHKKKISRIRQVLFRFALANLIWLLLVLHAVLLFQQQISFSFQFHPIIATISHLAITYQFGPLVCKAHW